MMRVPSSACDPNRDDWERVTSDNVYRFNQRYAENTQSITQDPEYFFYLSSAAQSPKRAIPILRLYQGVFADWFTFRYISEHFLSPG